MNELYKIANNNLIYFGERVEPYFASNIVAGGMENTRLLKRFFGISKPVRWVQVNQDFYNVKSDLDIFLPQVRNKISTREKTYVRSLMQNCVRAGARLLRHAATLGKQAKKSTLPKEDLANLLKAYHREAQDYCIYYNIAFFEKPELEIAKKLAERYSKGQHTLQTTFSLIAHPSRETDVEHEQDDFLRLCLKKVRNAKALRGLAEQHAQKYGWLALRFFLQGRLRALLRQAF